jgi:hypothetical protein
MGWNISVDVTRRDTHIGRVMFTKEGCVGFVKSVQLHNRVFASRVSETNGEEEEEGIFFKQEANKGI